MNAAIVFILGRLDAIADRLAVADPEELEEAIADLRDVTADLKKVSA